MPKVSVVVPIYNVEKYLRQCLDSIAGQTLRDIEIILVNDGSTDKSPEIIKEFAKRDKRIKVINQKNGGLGKAYNAGIDAASGEYIGFVESDDWIEPDMYEILHDLAKKNGADVAKGRHYIFDDGTGKTVHLSELPKQDTCIAFCPRKRPSIFHVPATIWSAIYKKEFLNAENIRFLETPGASYQDTSFNFKIWAMAESVVLTMKPLLHYRTGHCTQSMQSRDKVFCVAAEFKEIERYMIRRDPILMARLENMFNSLKITLYVWNYNRLDGENREMFRKLLAEELAPVMKAKKLYASHITFKEHLRLMRIIYPGSAWIKIKFFAMSALRLLAKTRTENGYRTIILLGGTIQVWRYKLKYKSLG
jgi:glycosyltransferase involved in cell wall biosynthesis